MGLQAFIVEDNPQIRDSLIEALAELAGIEAAGAVATEKAAIAWLSDASNHWDIAIVDLGLAGGGSGLGVLKAMRNRNPVKKMVVLTGTANPDVRKECESVGSDRVFDKSMETEALLEYCKALSTQAP